MGSVTHPSRAADSIEMARIVVRRRRRREQLRDHGQRQRQLAAGVGRNDDRRVEDVRRGQPGARRRAVHPRRRDGPGHDRGRGRAGPRRDARRRRARPTRAARFAGDLRQLLVVDGAAQRQPHVRHAGARARLSRRRPVGPPSRSAAALLRRVHLVEDRRRSGDERVGRVDDGRAAVRRQLHPPLGRLAGGRSGDGLREVHDGSRPVRRRPHLPEGIRSLARSVRPRRLRRDRPGQALLLRTAHAAPLRDRVLRAGAQRLVVVRAVARRWRAQQRGSRRTCCAAKCSPTTRRHRSTTRSTPRCSSSSTERKASMPDQWY